MITLLLDSSTTKLGVGFAKKNEVFASVFYEAWQKQSELMIPEIKKLMEGNSIDKNDIDSIVVTIGPGSYTGTRIAVTIAKVMALVLNVPIYEVSSLGAFKDGDNKSICLINARSARSYFAVYEGAKEVIKDKILTNEEVLSFVSDHKDYVVCGDTKYLSIDGKQTNIFEQMLSFKKDEYKSKDILGVKPVYLKD